VCISSILCSFEYDGDIDTMPYNRSRCGTLSNIRGSDCKPTTALTARQSHHLRLVHPATFAHSRKLVLWRGTRNGHGYLLMRLKSCSSYRRGLLTTMTLFSSGQGGMHNSKIFLVSREIFFPSQVCISPLLFAELLTCYTPKYSLADSAVAVEQIFSGG
jgi:hypothetical protein